MDIFKDICQQNIEDYGKKFENWIIHFVNQNSKRTHFLYELIQNAEDAGANKIEFRLYKDHLEVEHNGRPFNEDDIRSICGVGESTKNIDDMIGKFGIGFKSVYAYTLRPSIYSGKLAFAINNYIMPEQIVYRKDIKPLSTLFVLPFDKETTKNVAYTEILKAFNDEITPESILFLSKIETIKLFAENLDVESEITRASKSIENDHYVNKTVLSMTKHNKRTGNPVTKSIDYLLFSDAEKQSVKVAYQILGYEIKAVSNSCFYSFLPTEIESHQNYYIHAPFNTTPSRDSIYDDDVNRRMAKRLGALICKSLVWLKSKSYLTINSLSVILPVYKYNDGNLFNALYQSSVDFIKSAIDVIPTNVRSVYRNIHDVCLPASMNIIDVFDDKDLKYLLNEQDKFWISKEIVTASNKSLLDFFINEFSIKTYEWKDLIRKLNSAYLESKNRDWFEKFFDSVESFCTRRRGTSAGNYIDVHDIPLIRLDNGRNIVPLLNEIPQVYINNPDNCSNKIDQTFINSDIIRNFYLSILDVPEYNILRTAMDKILPKYENPLQIRFQSDKKIRENIEDLKHLKEAVNASKYNDVELLAKIERSYLVTDGKEWYKPNHLHIPQSISCIGKTEMEILSSLENVTYLDDIYSSEPFLDADFFRKIGCSEFLNTKKVSEKDYLFYVKKYIGKDEAEKIRTQIFNKEYTDGIDWSYSYEGLPEFLDNFSRQKSYAFARFLNKNTTRFDIEGKMFGAGDQSFNGANVHSLRIYSALGLFLTYCPWLYSKDGRKVSAVEININQLDETYEKECKRLIGMLHFQEKDEAILNIISRYEGEERELLESILSSNEDLDRVTKLFKESKLREQREKNKEKLPPNQALQKIAERNERMTDKSDRETIVESIKDVEKRRAKIEKNFEESMNRKTNFNKHLHYTFQDSTNVEERSFLGVQYEGHCQICDKTIIRHDGKPHFHAINIIKTGQLAPEYTNALDEGWNSLCLCPNCAWEYKVGPKDLSDFKEQVARQDIESGSAEHIEINIILQGIRKTIRYAPKHFIALKTALEFFDK